MALRRKGNPVSWALSGYRWAWIAARPAARLLLARRGDGRFLSERMGRGWADPAPGAVWIHCASVGEVRTACPLAQALRRQGSRELLFSTNTATGAQTLARVLPEGVRHVYLPIDARAQVSAFLEAWRPRALLVCETEIWPELYHQCHARGIPIVIFNARLSARTLRAPGWVRRLYAEALGSVRIVLARSEADAARFRALGAPRVCVAGNLKWAACPTADPGPRPLAVPYWVGMSTHQDEELRLARIQQGLPPQAPMLVLIPRHPERGSAIASELRAARIPHAVRSRGEPAVERVYLADTLGEGERFMAHAELVFMGGSLVPAGGHNLLEPARLARAVVVGPHMEDFAEETGVLLRAGAAVRLRQASEAEHVLGALLADAQARARMGRAAAAVLEERGGPVVRHYLDALRQAGLAT